MLHFSLEKRHKNLTTGVSPAPLTIEFRWGWNAPTMVFEAEYPRELKMTRTERRALLESPDVLRGVVLLAGEEVGECIVSPLVVALSGEGCDFREACRAFPNPTLCWYIESFTILTRYQGLGLGTILRCVLAAYLHHTPQQFLTGHATSERALHLAVRQGARSVLTVENWYGTGKPAWGYVQDLL